MKKTISNQTGKYIAQIERSPDNIPNIVYKYETHNDRLLNEEFDTPEKLVKRAVLLGKVSKENEPDLIDYIASVMDGSIFYHMTDYKVDENGTVSIPLTLKSLDGFLAQWEYERHGFATVQAPQEPNQLPDELNTPKAKELFQRAIEAGFINDDYTFRGTRYQMAYFAEKASKYLNLRNKWKPFIELWNYKYFSQTRRESIERIGYVDNQDEIDKLFI